MLPVRGGVKKLLELDGPKLEALRAPFAAACGYPTLSLPGRVGWMRYDDGTDVFVNFRNERVEIRGLPGIDGLPPHGCKAVPRPAP